MVGGKCHSKTKSDENNDEKDVEMCNETWLTTILERHKIYGTRKKRPQGRSADKALP
jgi:hypothetical protein